MSFDYKKVMRDYHSDNPATKNAAVETMLNSLKGFIFSCMQKNYPTYIASEYNDMLQSAYLAIIKSMENYDPELSSPTTYFAIYIKQGIQLHLNKQTNPTSVYYRGINKKIRDIDPDGVLDNEEVAKICGVSKRTIVNAREVDAVAHKISIEDKPNEKSSFCLPEEHIIKEVEIEAFYKYLNSALSTTEKNIIFDLFGLAGHPQCSISKIAKKLKTSARKIAEIQNEAYEKLRTTEFLHIFECNESEESEPMSLLESCEI